MSNPDHLAKLLQGAEAWNAWRAANPDIVPDLSGGDLTERAGLARQTLSGGLNLSGVLLQEAKLSGACLTDADLAAASLTNADLRHADLSRTNLVLADLSCANLTQARFHDANLGGTNLHEALLHGADLGTAIGLMPEQIAHAACDERTCLPFEADQPSAGFHGNAGEEFDPFPFEEDQLPADPFVALEVSRDADTDAIRMAYRGLAKKYHPDVNPDDPKAERRFAHLNEAYQAALAAKELAAQPLHKSAAGRWGIWAAIFLFALALPSGAVLWLDSSGQSEAILKTADALITGSVETAEIAKTPRLPQGAGTERDKSADEAVPKRLAALMEAPAPNRQEEITPAWDKEWQSLRETDDLIALQDFISRHKAKAPAAEARQRFSLVLDSTDDPGTLRQLIGKMRPAAPETALANKRLARLIESTRDDIAAWETARAAGTIAAYRLYLMNYPDGRFAGAADRRLASLLAEVARHRKDEDDWATADAKGTRKALETYRDAHPDGQYLGAAAQRLTALDAKIAERKKRDDRAWASARRKNTPNSYQAYLKTHPAGRHTAQARDAIKAEEIKSASIPERSAAQAVSIPETPAEAQPDPRPEPRPLRRALRFPSSDEPFVEPLSRRN